MRLENRRGSEHPTAKFEDEEAAAVRDFFRDHPGAGIRSLARKLEVAPMTIFRLLHQITYRR